MKDKEPVEQPITINKDYKVVSVRSRLVLFAVFYSNLPLHTRYLVIVICSLIAGFLNAILIKNTGVYLSGIVGITNGLARIAYAKTDSATLYNALYWGLVVAANIPLLIFSFFKMGVTFTGLTAAYLLTTYAGGFALGSIKQLDDVFIFGRSLAEEGQFVTAWSAPGNGPLILLCYAAVYAVFNGLMFSLMYITGGSSGGLDFLVFYLSKYKNKSIGPVLMLFNTLSLILATVIGSYIANSQSKFPVSGATSTQYSIDLLFSPNLVFSLVGSVLQILVIGAVFPRDKKALVTINSEKSKEIADRLITTSYQHPFTKMTVYGGFTNKQRVIIETVCMYNETLKLTELALEVDPNAFITYSKIRGVTGRFSTRK